MNITEKARFDLAARANTGTFLYVLIWVGVGFWLGIFEHNPKFFLAVTVSFFAIAFIRTNLQSEIITNQGQSARLENLLNTAIIANGFLWGGASSWVVLNPSFEQHEYLFMIISTGFAMGGSATLSISKAIRFWYPVGVFSPLILTAFYLGDPENYGKIVLIMGSLFYIWKAGKICANDYYTALKNQMLAEERAQELEQLSVTDALTRLPNRAHFDAFFLHEWQRCSRLGASLSVFMIDLDHFKALNDTHGHLCGDQVLQETAAGIRKIFSRTSDTVNRYGGEEFVAVTSGTSVAQARQLAERVVQEISAMETYFNGRLIKVTCSVGVATGTPEQGLTNAAMLLAADQALYQVKRAGRNNYQSVDLNKPAETSAKLSLVKRLEE